MPEEIVEHAVSLAFERAAEIYPPAVAGAIRWSLGDGVMVDAAQAALIAEILAAEPRVEHAVRMSGGDMCVHIRSPETDRICPIDQWIEYRYTVDETKVYTRKVIVVEDWAEVERGE